MEKTKLTKNEAVGIVTISLVLALRQMSMTIVAPFISTYCKDLAGYTPLSAGLALGIFGLTQSIFQIPFGVLSDRYGNKKMMLIGLSQVVAGLVTAYFAKNIYLLVFARALQGSGAIIGVGYSWAAGMVDKTKRTKAMSILGAFISTGAAIAFALGPILRGFMAVNQIFLVGAVMIFIIEMYILLSIKDTRDTRAQKAEKESLNTGCIKILFKNRAFILMGAAAFLNNFMMMSVFYAMPMYLNKIVGETGMWKVFVPAVIIAVLLLKVTVSLANKGYSNKILILSFMLTTLSILFYFRKTSFVFLLVGTILFMSGYVSLAAIIAANINNKVEDSYRGTANGIFNAFQYMGNFVGPVVTGLVWGVSDRLALAIVICAGIIGMILTAVIKKQNTKLTLLSD